MRGFLVAGLFALLPMQTETVVPVYEEPRHRMVFEAPGTRILDVQIPPGDTTLYHTHSNPILYVTMSTSRTRSQSLGGEWSNPPGGASAATVEPTVAKPTVAPTSPPGRMFSVTTYADRPQTHRVNNLGPSLYRLIAITNASPGDERPDPSPDFDTTPEVTNQWFRGYRLALAGAPSPEHRHANAVALVVVAGSGSLTAAGADSRALAQPGAFAFVEANVPHTLRATASDTQVVEIEIRRPR